MTDAELNEISDGKNWTDAQLYEEIRRIEDQIKRHKEIVHLPAKLATEIERLQKEAIAISQYIDTRE